MLLDILGRDRAITAIPTPSSSLLKSQQSRWSQVNVNHLQQNIHAIIRPGDEGGYFAECLEIAVVTQGLTLDEVSKNLLEVVSLHLEDEDSANLICLFH